MRLTSGSAYLFRFAGALLVVSAIIVIMACGSGSKNPAAPSTTSLSASAFSADTLTSVKAQAKVNICHRTEGSAAFIPLSVAASALDAHIAHGDGLVGGVVPGQDGMQFGPSCEVVASRRTVSVSGVWNGTSYVFSGLFTVGSVGPVDATASVTGFSGSMHLALLGYNASDNTCSTVWLPTMLPPGPDMNPPTVSAHWDAVPVGTYCLNVVGTASVPPWPAPYSWTANIVYP